MFTFNSSMGRVAALLVCLLTALTAPLSGHADERQPDADRKQAFTDADAAKLVGPKDIPLAGQAVLHLPAGEVFIPQPQAARMLVAMGNPGTHGDLQGLVFPQREQDNWFATVRYIASGYVKDGDAKEWDADEMLKSFREGTEESNAERQKMGVAAMEIVGWAEKPTYDATAHRLVWAMSSRDKGAPADAAQGVNYNTYALGREGYISLNLITGLNELPGEKHYAHELLAALDFNDGKRYADFNSSTDHVAEYGLAALVLGVGAKKLGLLAIAFGFVAKFAKLGVLLVAGLGAGAAKLFGRKKKVEATNPAEPPQA